MFADLPRSLLPGLLSALKFLLHCGQSAVGIFHQRQLVLPLLLFAPQVCRGALVAPRQFVAVGQMLFEAGQFLRAGIQRPRQLLCGLVGFGQLLAGQLQMLADGQQRVLVVFGLGQLSQRIAHPLLGRAALAMQQLFHPVQALQQVS